MKNSPMDNARRFANATVKPAPKLPPVRNFKKDQRIRTHAGKIAFVLEDSKGMAIVNVRFLDNSTAQIPARFILGDE